MFVLPLSRPSSLVRRNAVSPSFASAIDRLFDDSFGRSFGSVKADAETRAPAMDVSESDTGYTVVLDVPGVSREQLKVSVEGRRLVLSTVVPAAAAAEPAVEGDPQSTKPAKAADRVIYRERSTVAYARTVVLPAEVDQTQSSAKFDDGVLTLTLTRKVPAGASQLSIA